MQLILSERTDISNALEAKEIPADWVNAGDTYRSILREVVGYFLFMQRYTATTGFDPIAKWCFTQYYNRISR